MKPALKIFHNARCSKSRATLLLLEAKGEAFEVVDYLKTPPTVAELKVILRALNLDARAIVRVKEDVMQELNLNLDDEEAVLKALVKHPVLMERPIVQRGDRAVIGRPPENIHKLWT